MISLTIEPQFETKFCGQWTSSTSRSVLSARKIGFPAGPIGSDTGLTDFHLLRFLTSHFPSRERYCSCQARESLSVTFVARNSEIKPATARTEQGVYNTACVAGAGIITD